MPFLDVGPGHTFHCSLLQRSRPERYTFRPWQLRSNGARMRPRLLTPPSRLACAQPSAHTLTYSDAPRLRLPLRAPRLPLKSTSPWFVRPISRMSISFICVIHFSSHIRCPPSSRRVPPSTHIVITARRCFSHRYGHTRTIRLFYVPLVPRLVYNIPLCWKCCKVKSRAENWPPFIFGWSSPS